MFLLVEDNIIDSKDVSSVTFFEFVQTYSFCGEYWAQGKERKIYNSLRYDVQVSLKKGTTLNIKSFTEDLDSDLLSSLYVKQKQAQQAYDKAVEGLIKRWWMSAKKISKNFDDAVKPINEEQSKIREALNKELTRLRDIADVKLKIELRNYISNLADRLNDAEDLNK